MKVAVLSGKGGAGKTLLAVNLAAAAGKATYVDCDVEEPNGGFSSGRRARCHSRCILPCPRCPGALRRMPEMRGFLPGFTPWCT